MALGNKGGRTRLSKNEKAKKGTLEKGREKKYEAATMKVVKMTSLPEPPARLGEIGKEHWMTLVAELDKNKALAGCDLGMLEALCHEWEGYIEYVQFLKKNKGFYSIPGEDGKPRTWVQHPAQYNRKDHLREYQALCREFGFSPWSRARIGLSAQDKEKGKAAQALKSLGKTASG